MGKNLTKIFGKLSKIRKIRGLSKETIKLLKRIESTSRYYKVRQRALCIQLSYKNYTIQELSHLFDVTYLTIQRWLDRWDNYGLVGLDDRQGRGRTKLLNSAQESPIKSWAKFTPKPLELVQVKMADRWKIKVSKYTIKGILKKLNMSWHKTKKVVGGAHEEIDYKRKKAELQKSKIQAKQGKIDFTYLDESGFDRIPVLPYAWPEKGEYIEIKSQPSKRLNGGGILNRNNELFSDIFEGAISSDMIVSCIDKFCQNLTKKTVLVMDNASIYTANKIPDKFEEWE